MLGPDELSDRLGVGPFAFYSADDSHKSGSKDWAGQFFARNKDTTFCETRSRDMESVCDLDPMLDGLLATNFKDAIKHSVTISVAKILFVKPQLVFPFLPGWLKNFLQL